MSKLEGNCSSDIGGPTSVINASASGIQEALKLDDIFRYTSCHGIKGLLNGTSIT